MRLIEKAYQAAQIDLGLDWKELSGPESNERILACYKAVDGLGNPEMWDDSKIAWCSCYVNKKIQDAGGRGTRSAAARSWLRWGKEIKTPHEGCVVILKRGKSEWQGHVGFLSKIDYKYVWILGGNQHNEVNITRFLRTDILGFRTSND